MEARLRIEPSQFAEVGMLPDAQWARVSQLLPQRRRPRVGRPPADIRRAFGGVLWRILTKAPWREMPRTYGSPATCVRRLREWERAGMLDSLLDAALEGLAQGRPDLFRQLVFLDARH
ncbi:MAG: transposase [Elusimicrobia bacterium]|nr:transposase [Elusimicrobiota bacterium]